MGDSSLKHKPPTFWSPSSVGCSLNGCSVNNDPGSARCIFLAGRLAVIDPRKILPALCDQAAAESPLTRATVVGALKFCMHTDTKSVGIDEVKLVLQPIVAQFLHLLADESLAVVEATLITLNAIAHHQPGLLRHLFYASRAEAETKETKESPNLWPSVFDHMQVKKELKRTVDLGPFKQKVDDGLPLRKASLTCMDTMLSTMPQLVDVETFMPHLKSGLEEREYDVKMLCHQILIKLCDQFPAQVSA